MQAAARQLAIAPAGNLIRVPLISVLTTKQMAANELLAQPQRHTLLVGGSRSGKTFKLTRAVCTRAIKAAGSRHCIMRFRYNAVRASVWLDTFVKVMKKCWPGLLELCREHRQEGYVELPNGSEIWFAGLDEKERVEKILGMEFATLYFVECSQIPYSSVLLALTRLAQKVPTLRNRAYYDLNPTSLAHWTAVLFIEKRDPITRNPLVDPENYAMMYMNPEDNIDNLDADYVRSLKVMPERQRRRFYEGKYVSEVDGALWTIDLIERQRLELDEVPKDLARITVNVDPSGCKGNEDFRSDEVGITVTARYDQARGEPQGFLLADLSGRMKPEEWGALACRAAEQWGADCIVGETNYGGDMVRATVHAANRNVRFKMVTATRGKVQRAEPISALYETGRIFHVGRFANLEDQLCNFSTNGYKGERSPDRADSAIWGFHELLLGKSTTGLFEFMRSQADKAANKDAV